MARILVVDDQEMMRDSLAATLAREGHEIVASGDGPAAVDRLSSGGRFDLLITDLKMPRMTGIELLAEAKRLRPEMPVVLMTAFATVQTAVEAMKLGAYDYIQKPFDGDEIRLLVERTLEHSRLVKENQALRTMAEQLAPRPLVGSGETMDQVRQRIELVARSSATVLIRGESGTGKEVVARAIHAASERRERPMLAVNCAALTENLLESELFGHEKGAFTGADKPAAAASSWPTAARCCWMRSARSPPACRPSCCACSRKAVRARRQQRDAAGGRPRRRHDEPRPGAGRGRRQVPPGPVLPPERRPDRAAAAAGAAGGHPGAVPPFPAARSPSARTRRSATSSPRRSACCSDTPGRATSASCRTSSSGQACWSPSRRHPRRDDRALARAAPGRRRRGVENLAGKPLADIEKQVILSTLQQFKGHRMKTAGALGIGVRTLGMKLKRWKEEGDPAALEFAGAGAEEA